MTKTAVAAPEQPQRFYVLRLEEAVRALDHLVSTAMPTIRADRPEDHTLTREVAELVVALREAP